MPSNAPVRDQTGPRPDVVAAFVTAADAGLRVIGWSVFVIGGLVLLESLLSRRRLPVPA